MERFDFFFGGRLHSHTNNLSKDLKGTEWRLVLVQEATPKLPKITLEGSIMKLLILSSGRQESFSSYAQMETLLVKAGNGDHYEAEFKFLEVSYSLYRGATLACNWVFSGAPNENLVQNHLNIALLNALIFSI